MSHESLIQSVSTSSAGVLAGLDFPDQDADIRIIKTFVIQHDHEHPLDAIEQIIQDESQRDEGTNPHDSGWLILLGYELGEHIEPSVRVQSGSDTDTKAQFPLAVLQRWVRDRSDRALSDRSFEAGKLESSMGRAGYIDAVVRTMEYIRAGDIYQANITHQLVGRFDGDTRSCFDQLSRNANPRMGAMMCFDHQIEDRTVRHAILSISPELFVECDFNSGFIRTEPMKGTRPIGADPDELRDSIKDRAELDMITDLMRNVLGRLCIPGSVRVIDPRWIEAHQSGVIQASSKIEGRMRSEIGLIDLIRACFPPGSITGAPKVRAMQIIKELETEDRGPYCGSMLVLNDAQQARPSVTIRTAHIRGGIDPECATGIKGGRLVYPVGAGIVADSDPESEWAETLLKADGIVSGLQTEIRVD